MRIPRTESETKSTKQGNKMDAVVNAVLRVELVHSQVLEQWEDMHSEKEVGSSSSKEMRDSISQTSDFR
jgi:hypothetical protein